MITPSFRALFFTQALGALNDNLLKNAILFFIAFSSAQSTDNPEIKIAITAGIFILPYFLFSGSAGALADHFPKDRLLHRIKLLEIPVMLVAIAGFILGYLWIEWIALFLAGTQAAFFSPAKYSIIPEITPPQKYFLANAYLESGTFLAILIGTLLANALTSPPFSETPTLNCTLIGLAVIGALWAQKIRCAETAPLAKQTSERPRFKLHLLRDSQALFAATHHSRPLNESIGLISWFWGFGSLILSILPILCKNNFADPKQKVTWILTLFSVGIGIGSFASVRIGKKIGSQQKMIGLSLVLITLLCISEAFVLMHAPHAFLIIAVHLFLISFFSGMYTVPLYTNLQTLAQGNDRSKVIGANNIGNSGAMVGGALLLAVYFKFTHALAPLFLLLGAVNFVFIILLFNFFHMRHLKYE